MCQAHTRLAVTMLLALGSLATAAGAVRAEAVVVAATAPGYTAGQQLGTDPITVPDGATLVFLLKTGQVVTVKGPYEGPPPAATGDAGNRFDRLTRLGGTDQAEIGGTRSLSAIGNVTRNLPLDLYLATDRGRYPVYRPGEPIRLVLQTNRDAHTYCWLKDTRRRVVPLFPNTAAEAQPLRGGLTLRLPGAGQAGVAVEQAFNKAELRCMARTAPLEPDLVQSFLAADGRALPGPVASRLEAALAGSGVGTSRDVVLAQLVLKVSQQ
jgi:hypothetical protein